ncbi:hypothetical protein BHE74_00026274 [Ensete ventricosum]|nr:hypothetical protein GW17_00055493 [Ensete ventricosum]RWW66361.1 hypothetical protein BHE74_00026274 [Ensete ventricosum]
MWVLDFIRDLNWFHPITGVGGYSYLYEPLWWIGMITKITNEKQEWDGQNPTQIVTEMCGFVTILSGTFLLHKTKDMADGGTLCFSVEGVAVHTILDRRAECLLCLDRSCGVDIATPQACQ